MNMIELKFDNTLTSLAGFPYGKSTFEEQVKNKINLTEDTKIVFPNNIERIAISFVQGFSAEIIKQYGTEIFNTKLIIDGSDRVKDKFRKVLI